MKYHKRFLLLLMLVLVTGSVFAGTGDQLRDQKQSKEKQARITKAIQSHAFLPNEINSQTQGFENPAFPPAGWDTVQNDGGISNWYRTPTNPHSGVAATRVEYEGPDTANDDWLISPLVFPRALAGDTSVVFYYRAQSASYVDSFEVWVSTEANGNTPAQFLSGGTRIYNNTTNSYTTYQRAEVSLSAFYGQKIYIAWRYDARDQYRLYIDDVTMPDVPPATVNDIAANALDVPAPGGFVAVGTSFSPKATFKNVGSADQISPFDVKYEILNGVPSAVYSDVQSIASLASGVTQQVTFSPSGTGLVAGTYTIRAIANLGTDASHTNDTLVSFITVEPKYSIPYTQDFEGATNEGWTTVATGGLDQWVRGTPAKALQITGAHTGTKAWVTRLDSNYANDYNAALVSPLFDFSAVSGSYGLLFWHNFLVEVDYDAGVLEYSTDGGVWLRVDSVLGTGSNFMTAKSTNWYNNSSTNGAVQPPKWSNKSTAYTGNTSGYIHSKTKLGGFAGLPAIKFRWRFVSDASGDDEGWAIDDIEIKVVDFHDIGLAGLEELVASKASEAKSAGGKVQQPQVRTKPSMGLSLAPSTRLRAGSAITVNATVQNYGTFIESSYQVAWEIDGAPQTNVSNVKPLTIGGVDTLALVWPAPTSGLHSIRAWTVLASDTIRTNDSSGVLTVFVSPVNTVFEERFNGPFPPAGWTTVNRDGGGTRGPWFKGHPAYFAGLEGPDSGYAADDYHTANGLYIDDYLITPNTGSLTGGTGLLDSLVFYVRSNYNDPGSNYDDSLEIRVSTTGTDTSDFTLLLDYINVPKGVWTRFAYALPAAGQRYIAFRYLMYDGGSSGDYSDYIGLDVVHIVRATATMSVAPITGWDMLSVPVIVSDFRKNLLFPTAVSGAYAYQGNYAAKDTLSIGVGYWLKFPAPVAATMTGFIVIRDSVDVRPGWNMIGTISTPVKTATITSVPGGIVTSSFFGYNFLYEARDTLLPGHGYWVKVNQAGKLVLSSSMHFVSGANLIKIVEDGERPPMPPDGKELIQANEVPATYGLAQAYPNPFNPTTTIKYQIPDQSKVVVKVYNLLGQVVAVLADEVQDAGYKAVHWNAAGMTSGVYFYRLEATNVTDPGKSFSKVMRMIVLK